MEIETTLAKSIHAASENAQYDAACKRVLSDKYVLAWIMKSCLVEYWQCTIEEIAEKYIEGQPSVGSIPVNPDETNPVIRGLENGDTTITEGTVVYDIRFLAYAPRTGELIRLIINLEAHQNFKVGYPLIKRAIYYCSRMISAQHGTEFTKSHYEKISKVYSIWICPAPPEDRRNSITRYRIREENVIGYVQEAEENYDLMTVIMICLGNPEEVEPDGILRLLSILLSNETEDNEKKRILKEEFAMPITETLERSLDDMCNLSIGVEEKGRAKGRAEGRAEGQAEATIALIRNLMDSMGFSLEKAMQALRISEEDRAKYTELLGKQ